MVTKKPILRIPYIDTTIPSERTKAIIAKLLKDHSIEDVQWTTYHGETHLKFLWKLTIKGVQKEIMFEFNPPQILSKKRSWTGKKSEMVTVNLEATSYRLLWHYLKNKLEAVRWGLESMEKEFLSHAVVALADGSTTTVGEQINKIYETLKQPALIQRQNGAIEGEIVEK